MLFGLKVTITNCLIRGYRYLNNDIIMMTEDSPNKQSQKAMLCLHQIKAMLCLQHVERGVGQ